MRILFLGDVVGEPGRRVVGQALPVVQAAYEPDLVVANAENAAGGSGLDRKCFDQLRQAGVHAFTMGDHIYKRREIMALFGEGAPICRPANFPPQAPGPDHLRLTAADGTPVAVISLLGRLFMKPVDCPFRAVDRVLAALSDEVRVILIDVHAEATSEKMAFAHMVDGRASLVVGTHTHVPTADHMILAGGTAYMSDAGMCGDYDSVIGMRKAEPIARFLRKLPTDRLTPAEGEATVSGLLVETDEKTGLARRIEPLREGGKLAPVMPVA